jgi:hypothetical protein
MYTGQELPAAVEELEGTPLYSGSEELTRLAGGPDAVYLLIAPQDPSKALLVQEKGAEPSAVTGRESKPIKVSGSKKSLKSEPLLKHVQERYELELQTDPSGGVVLLMAEPVATAEDTTVSPPPEPEVDGQEAAAPEGNPTPDAPVQGEGGPESE